MPSHVLFRRSRLVLVVKQRWSVNVSFDATVYFIRGSLFALVKVTIYDIVGKDKHLPRLAS